MNSNRTDKYATGLIYGTICVDGSNGTAFDLQAEGSSSTLGEQFF